MAYKTLAQLRAELNNDLFIVDADTHFGTTTQRNYALQAAFRKLWPTMARLVRESVTPLTDTVDYTLTSLRDIERVEILDSSGVARGKLNAFQLIADESADPIVYRLRLATPLATDVTLRLTGYQPYKVPANDADTCDLPSHLEHVVITGARAEVYRGKLNAFMDYEQVGVQNRTTAVGVPELRDMYLVAVREFEALRQAHRRELVGSKRATMPV